MTQKTNITAHAEAILGKASTRLDNYGPNGRAAILAAVTAVFDAGAEAMRSEATTAVQAMENPFDGKPEAHVYERGVLEAFAALRAIDPETLREVG